MRRLSWLRWPWVSAEWADTLQERADRLRDEPDEALDQRDTAVFNREQILRQLADALTANRRVSDRNLEKRVKHLKKELDNATGLPVGGPLSSAPWQPGYRAPESTPKAAS